MVSACEGPCTTCAMWNDRLFEVARTCCISQRCLGNPRVFSRRIWGAAKGRTWSRMRKRSSLRNKGRCRRIGGETYDNEDGRRRKAKRVASARRMSRGRARRIHTCTAQLPVELIAIAHSPRRWPLLSVTAERKPV